jgi:phosphoserine phosphatase
MITILSPRTPRGASLLRLASRPPSLNGKTIGFIDNGKRNFDAYLDRTEELLRDKYDFVAIRRRKPSPLKGIPRELFEDMVERCDTIITGSGD